MLNFRVMIWLIRGVILPRATLLAENLALRQQLLVLQRSLKRPTFYFSDRHFWSFLSCFWKDWKLFLRIVQPDTVVKASSVAGHKTFPWEKGTPNYKRAVGTR
jgi:hypothetical protein